MEWINVIMVILGGAMVKLLDVVLRHFSDTKERELTEMEIYSRVTSDIREELREDQSKLRGEFNALKEELDAWKERYYKVFEQHAREKALNVSLQRDITRLTKQVEELTELKEIVRSIEDRLGKPIHELTPEELKAS